MTVNIRLQFQMEVLRRNENRMYTTFWSEDQTGRDH